MNLLALETSGFSGHVACFRGAELLQQVTLPHNQRSAQALLPAIERILSQVGWKPAEIDMIAVTVGPGSFTGLRVGVTTAKTLAYATKSQTIGVGTLDVIAHQALPTDVDGPLHVVMDAQRKQFFWAIYQRDATAQTAKMRMTRAPEIIDQKSWLADRSPHEWVTGPGLRRCQERACAARAVHESLWSPSAVAVGQVALLQLAECGPNDLWELVPKYYRKSAAEEKRDKP